MDTCNAGSECLGLTLSAASGLALVERLASKFAVLGFTGFGNVDEEPARASLGPLVRRHSHAVIADWEGNQLDAGFVLVVAVLHGAHLCFGGAGPHLLADMLVGIADRHAHEDFHAFRQLGAQRSRWRQAGGGLCHGRSCQQCRQQRPARPGGAL